MSDNVLLKTDTIITLLLKYKNWCVYAD